MYVPLAASGAVNVAANHLTSVTVDVLGYAVADDGAQRSGRYRPLQTPAGSTPPAQAVCTRRWSLGNRAPWTCSASVACRHVGSLRSSSA